MKNKQQLKPCPFCGCLASTYKLKYGWYVACNDCPCEMGYYIEANEPCGEFKTEEEAISFWNKRV